MPQMASGFWAKMPQQKKLTIKLKMTFFILFEFLGAKVHKNLESHIAGCFLVRGAGGECPAAQNLPPRNGAVSAKDN